MIELLMAQAVWTENAEYAVAILVLIETFTLGGGLTGRTIVGGKDVIDARWPRRRATKTR